MRFRVKNRHPTPRAGNLRASDLILDMSRTLKIRGDARPPGTIQQGPIMLRYALICPVVILTGISCSKTWVAPRLDPSANQGDETLRDGSRAPRRDPVPYDRAG